MWILKLNCHVQRNYRLVIVSKSKHNFQSHKGNPENLFQTFPLLDPLVIAQLDNSQNHKKNILTPDSKILALKKYL